MQDDPGSKSGGDERGRGGGGGGLGKKGNQHAARLAAEARTALEVNLRSGFWNSFRILYSHNSHA